jgi:hypothetical protein
MWAGRWLTRGVSELGARRDIWRTFINGKSFSRFGHPPRDPDRPVFHGIRTTIALALAFPQPGGCSNPASSGLLLSLDPFHIGLTGLYTDGLIKPDVPGGVVFSAFSFRQAPYDCSGNPGDRVCLADEIPSIWFLFGLVCLVAFGMPGEPGRNLKWRFRILSALRCGFWRC